MVTVMTACPSHYERQFSTAGVLPVSRSTRHGAESLSTFRIGSLLTSTTSYSELDIIHTYLRVLETKPILVVGIKNSPDEVLTRRLVPLTG